MLVLGRAEKRKKGKTIKRVLTSSQLKELENGVNNEYIASEVNLRIENYQKLWTDSIIEAFKKCGYTLDKAKILLDETESIMVKKVAVKRNGKS